MLPIENGDKLITVTAPKSTFIVITENHGGYTAGYCIICGGSGWTDNINHSKDCPVK